MPLMRFLIRRRAAAVLLMGILGVGGLLTFWTVKRTDGALREALLNDALLIAHAVDIHYVKSLQGSNADLDRPEYLRLKSQFAAVLCTDERYRFVYLMGLRDDGTLIFLVDNESPSSPDYSPPGQVYEDKDIESTLRAFTGIALTEGPYTDAWGRFITALAPIVDPHTKETVAVLGLDIDAALRARTLWRAALAPALFTLALMTILFVSVFGVRRLLLAQPRPDRWVRHVDTILVVLIGFLLSLFAATTFHRHGQFERQRAFSRIALGRINRVAEIFNRLQHFELESLARFFENSTHVERHEFEMFTEFLKENPAVLAWEWAPLVAASEQAQVAALFNADGLGIFDAWEWSEDGKRQPVSGRSYLYPVLYSEPPSSTATGLGYDLGSDSRIREALEEAQRTGLVIATPPLTYFHEPSNGQSIMRVCRYVEMTSPDAVFQRGFVVAVLSIPHIREILTGDVSMQIALVEPDGSREPLTTVGPSCSALLSATLTHKQPIFAFGRTFSVLAGTDAALLRQYPARDGWAVALIGIILTAAAALFVELRTQMRESATQRQLRQVLQEWRITFDAIKDPICLLDIHSRVMRCNRAFAFLLGKTFSDIIGRRCHELVHGTNTPTNGCPFEEIKKTRHRATMPLAFAGRRFDVICDPVLNRKGELSGAVHVFMDISERTLLEARREIDARVLKLLNSEDDTNRLIAGILRLIKEHADVEAIGIRLRDGDDYPYFFTDGVSTPLVAAEHSLCPRDANGASQSNANGSCRPECICNNVLQRCFDPSQSFFTTKGSFWTNSMSTLFADPAMAEPLYIRRNRCCMIGYESLAFIPLQSGRDSILGLIQLSDRRANRLSLDLIEFIEAVGTSVGIALKRRHDTDALQRSEGMLQSSVTRYRTIFESSRDAIILLAPPAWIFSSANPAALGMFRLSDSPDLSTLDFTVLSPSIQPDSSRSAERIATMIEMALREGSCHMELTFQRCDGECFPARILLSRMKLDQQTMLQVCIRDVTEQKRQEAENVVLQAHLLQTQKTEAIGTLAGGVAHEINNPIMGIMNYAQLIKDRLSPDSPLAEFADEISKETERVAAIVRNLLTFARSDMEIDGVVDVAELINLPLSLVQTVLRHDRIELVLRMPPDLPPVRCRSQQIQQVLMSLVANARDALNARFPDGHPDKVLRITVCIPDDTITDRGDGSHPPRIRITIEDQGGGIPEVILGRIFDPFFTSKPRDRHAGLGLYISRNIVSGHQGQLSVETKPGSYTRFHVDLPLDVYLSAEGRTMS